MVLIDFHTTELLFKSGEENIKNLKKKKLLFSASVEIRIVRVWRPGFEFTLWLTNLGQVTLPLRITESSSRKPKSYPRGQGPLGYPPGDNQRERWRGRRRYRRANGEGRRLDLGWWTRSPIYRWCVIEGYTWNLYNFMNQCHHNKFNGKWVSKMVLERLDIQYKKVYVDLYLSLYEKINSMWIIEPHAKTKTIKLPEENKRKSLLPSTRHKFLR